MKTSPYGRQYRDMAHRDSKSMKKHARQEERKLIKEEVDILVEEGSLGKDPNEKRFFTITVLAVYKDSFQVEARDAEEAKFIIEESWDSDYANYVSSSSWAYNLDPRHWKVKDGWVEECYNCGELTAKKDKNGHLYCKICGYLDEDII